jgi:lipoyl(octanoyl) transferase
MESGPEPHIRDLGLTPYRQAWAIQEEEHARVAAGGAQTILLVEHPPVITFGRRPGQAHHLLASPDELSRRGVEVVESDRGGDVTFHGPGQIVAYPIIRLADHHLSVSAYVHRLEAVVIQTLAEIGISAQLDPAAIGVWTKDGPQLAKICAIGVRIRRGVTLHGLALNVETDLDYFNLINPCGLGRPVTTVQKILAKRAPSLQHIKSLLSKNLIAAFTAA